MDKTGFEVDFVVTWVDPADPEWQKSFEKHYIDTSKGKIDASKTRYRDWELLKYWFRGVEKFTPWVRYIHFVTCGHIPEWLDTTNPKLKIIKHEDYIPTKYLPLFNSRAIEVMMHRIPNLSERFVYFNDDFYLIRPTSPNHFFHNGKPCDMAVLKDHHSMDGIMLDAIQYDMRIIKEEFNVFANVISNPRLWFYPCYKGFLKLTLKSILKHKAVSLLDTHAPTPYLKSTFDEIWSKYASDLELTMSHKFRSSNEPCIWLFRYWQLLKGDITPRNTHETTKVFYYVDRDLKCVVDTISKQKSNIIVLNDNTDIQDLDTTINTVHQAFNKILPQKSSFEK